MISELESVVLTCDLPKSGLAYGDVGTVVLVHRDGKAYEVEFTALDGNTVAVVTLDAPQLRAATGSEIANARTLARVG